MNSIVASREFNPEKHIVDLENASWEPLYDEEGNKLEGIRGKTGSVEQALNGTEIGVDLIEMQPGSAFPQHTHVGDHILYAASGVGTVNIEDVTYRFQAGSTFFIAAEYPHNVGTYADATEPFVLLAFGHPHKHVSAHDRMQVVREEYSSVRRK